MKYQITVKKSIKSNFLNDKRKFQNIGAGTYEIDSEVVEELNLIERFAKFPDHVDLVKIPHVDENKNQDTNDDVDNTNNTTDDNNDNLETLTVPQLKELLDEKGIKYNAKDKKDELIALLESE